MDAFSFLIQSSAQCILRSLISTVVNILMIIRLFKFDAFMSVHPLSKVNLPWASVTMTGKKLVQARVSEHIEEGQIDFE